MKNALVNLFGNLARAIQASLSDCFAPVKGKSLQPRLKISRSSLFDCRSVRSGQFRRTYFSRILENRVKRSTHVVHQLECFK